MAPSTGRKDPAAKAGFFNGMFRLYFIQKIETIIKLIITLQGKWALLKHSKSFKDSMTNDIAQNNKVSKRKFIVLISVRMNFAARKKNCFFLIKTKIKQRSVAWR
jgi:hypothetical protein